MSELLPIADARDTWALAEVRTGTPPGPERLHPAGGGRRSGHGPRTRLRVRRPRRPRAGGGAAVHHRMGGRRDRLRRGDRRRVRRVRVVPDPQSRRGNPGGSARAHRRPGAPAADPDRRTRRQGRPAVAGRRRRRGDRQGRHRRGPQPRHGRAAGGAEHGHDARHRLATRTRRHGGAADVRAARCAGTCRGPRRCTPPNASRWGSVRRP